MIDLDTEHQLDVVALAREVRQLLSTTGRLGWEISVPEAQLTVDQLKWITDDDAPLPGGMINWTRTRGEPKVG